jgi:hypothetical protein
VLPQPASLSILQQRQHRERANLLRRHQQQQAPLLKAHLRLATQAHGLRAASAAKRKLLGQVQVFEKLHDIERSVEFVIRYEQELKQLPMSPAVFLQREQLIKELSDALQRIAAKLVLLDQEQPSFAQLEGQLCRDLEPVVVPQMRMMQQLEDLRRMQEQELSSLLQQHREQNQVCEQQQQRRIQGVQQQIPAEVLPQLPLASLTEHQWVALLDCALDGMHSGCSVVFVPDLQQESRQAAMADALWEALSRDADTRVTLQHRIKNGFGAVGALGGHRLNAYADAKALLFQVCADAKPGKIVWLRWRGLLPQLVAGEVGDVPQRVQVGLEQMVRVCLAHRQWDDLPVLQEVAQQLGAQVGAQVFLRGCFSACSSLLHSGRTCRIGCSRPPGAAAAPQQVEAADC